MTIEEIKCVANEWSDNFDSNIPNFARIKRDVALLSYKKGATMVNEKQPYTPADIQAFWIWAYNNGWYYSEDADTWVNASQLDDTKHTIEEVLKLWEEQRNVNKR